MVAMKRFLTVRGLAWWFGALSLSHAPALWAQVPPMLSYQGRLVVANTNYDGVAEFKLALVNGPGTTTFWSNDGSSAGGSPPEAAVPIPVSKGLYSVLLGDAALPNMTPVPASVFAQPDVRLRVWVKEEGGEFAQLTPDQRLVAVGYAFMAAAVADGSVTTDKIAAGAVGPAALAAGSVGSAQLASDPASLAKISGGALSVSGSDLTVSRDVSAEAFNGRLVVPGNTLAGNQAAIGGGASNLAGADYATIAGGDQNVATGFGSTVGGGDRNQATAGSATVGGGQLNVASASYAVTGGGFRNEATNLFATVGGGQLNSASGPWAVIGGGGSNAATGDAATISSGGAQIASGTGATVAGGSGNVASGAWSMVAGGLQNQAAGNTALAAGNRARALHDGTFVWADYSSEAPFASTTSNQFLVRASGGVGINTTNPQTALHVVGEVTATAFNALGTLALPPSASPLQGVIQLDGAPFLHSYGAPQFRDNGWGSTFVGRHAGNFQVSNYGNTGIGNEVLRNLADGYNNVAVGGGALSTITDGAQNTAVGINALSSVGAGAFNNTALGSAASGYLVSGQGNTALGALALYSWPAVTTGSDNTAVGQHALFGLTDGNGNIAIGAQAGSDLISGNNNLLIGHRGMAGESATIRLGTEGTQTRAFAAGVFGSTIPGGVTVLVGTNGQLGTLTSSARFKTDIQDMGSASDVLMQLRPVRFRYQASLDPQGTAQFGLVAEEVEQVAPHLVVHDAEGAPHTVRYDAVNALLLNEVQKLHRQAEAQTRTIAELQSAKDALEARLTALETHLRQRIDRQPEADRPSDPLAAAHPGLAAAELRSR